MNWGPESSFRLTAWIFDKNCTRNESEREQWHIVKEWDEFSVLECATIEMNHISNLTDFNLFSCFALLGIRWLEIIWTAFISGHSSRWNKYLTVDWAHNSGECNRTCRFSRVSISFQNFITIGKHTSAWLIYTLGLRLWKETKKKSVSDRIDSIVVKKSTITVKSINKLSSSHIPQPRLTVSISSFVVMPFLLCVTFLSQSKGSIVCCVLPSKIDSNSALNFFRFLQENPPYSKGAFRIEINFPAEYPFKPPKICFKTKIYHPNIDEKGQVCLPIISTENWKPATKTDQGNCLNK